MPNNFKQDQMACKNALLRVSLRAGCSWNREGDNLESISLFNTDT